LPRVQHGFGVNSEARLLEFSTGRSGLINFDKKATSRYALFSLAIFQQQPLRNNPMS